jgi:hypothetical protein
MAHTLSARLTRRPASARSASRSDDVIRERQTLKARANVALAAIWAGLTVAIVVYAIDNESLGAAALAVFTAWQLLVPWRAAFASDDAQRAPRVIAFR